MTRLKLSAAQMDRACGVLVGAAVGDALGAGYEFGAAPLTGKPAMIGGGLGNFEPGEWTDDTAQTCAIARVALTGADLRSDSSLDRIAAGFLDWYAGDPPDVGTQTRRVLSRIARAEPESCPRAEPVEAQTREGLAARMTAAAADLHRRTGHTAGNGSLMRTSPVALAHLDDPAALVDSALAVSALTHADPLAGEACALWCLTIRHTVLAGEFGDLAEGLELLPEDRRQFWRERITEAEQNKPNSFTPNGFVVTALQAAWSTIVRTPVPTEDPAGGSFACQHFGHSLETAIRIGDDTDTVASIAGALLGARWGVSAIPSAWREILHGWPNGTATDLVTAAVLTARGGERFADGWPGLPRVDYSRWSATDTLVRHPHDSGVYLGGVGVLDHLPDDVTAVVSFCRIGLEQVPAGIRHVDFRLIDTDEADNPNLAFVVDDAARCVQRLRDEGEVVLLHCVQAQSRTPVVASRYSMLLGAGANEASHVVGQVLPDADPRPALAEGLTRFCRSSSTSEVW